MAVCIGSLRKSVLFEGVRTFGRRLGGKWDDIWYVGICEEYRRGLGGIKGWDVEAESSIDRNVRQCGKMLGLGNVFGERSASLMKLWENSVALKHLP